MLMLVSQANLGQLAKVVEQAGGDEARVTTLVRKGEAKVPGGRAERELDAMGDVC